MTAEENPAIGDSQVVPLTEEQKQFLITCETEYCHRYTEADPEFVQYKDSVCSPPIVDPWYNKPRRNFDWSSRGGGGRRHHNWRNDKEYNQSSEGGGYNRQGDRFYGYRHRPY